MRRSLRRLLAISLLLFLPAFWPAATTATRPTIVTSQSIGQPADWTPLAGAVSAREAWYAALPTPATAAPPARRRSGTVTSAVYGSGACGGDLPPCSVLACESGGNLHAHNASGADGKWQMMPGTWGNYQGYEHPSDAPESVQDDRAREVYAGGAGRSHWVC